MLDSGKIDEFSFAMLSAWCFDWLLVIIVVLISADSHWMVYAICHGGLSTRMGHV